MNVKEFNKVFNHAKTVNIVNDDFFNVSGCFWIGLTERQHLKMYNLMLKQGAKEIENKKGRKQIQLANGLGILKPQE